jgi:hypothetical protein
MPKKLIENFPHRLGMNCLTSSIRDVMEFNGYRYSEDFCYGLSAGLCFWYSNYKKLVQVTGIGANIFDELSATTKIHHRYICFDNNDKAWDIACEFIDNNIPVTLDVEFAGYASSIDAMNPDSKVEKKMLNVLDAIDFRVGGHVTTMIGYDEQYVYLKENLFYKPVRVPIEVFKTARNPQDIDFVPPINGMHVFYFPESLPPIEYCIKIAIKRVVHSMQYSYKAPVYCYPDVTFESSGLKGIKDFFDSMDTWIDFESERLDYILSTLDQILNRWGSSEVNRVTYGRFLREAANILKDEKLSECAEEYIDLSRLWKKFLPELGAACQDKNTLTSLKFIGCKKEILLKETELIYKLDSIVKNWKLD